MTLRLTLRNIRRSINLGQPLPPTPGLEVRPRLVERKPQGLEWRRIGTTQWNKV